MQVAAADAAIVKLSQVKANHFFGSEDLSRLFIRVLAIKNKMMEMVNLRRGAFILFEGCDKSGKTTQTKKIVNFLKNQGIRVKYLNFPARDTAIGSVIDSYLKKKQNLSNQGIHLLFSANRWEMQNKMKKLLESGTTLIVDRYSFSGVAYSVAKGLDYEWCKSPERGLLRPDLVIYLNVPVDELSERGDFGSERYEVPEFQNNVETVFNRLYDEEKDYWIKIDASRSKNELYSELRIIILNLIKTVRDKPFQILW